MSNCFTPDRELDPPDDFWGDEEESEDKPIWECTGCNWVGESRPIGGECPKCMCQCEEEFL